jgi:NDP-sugar pyrophosphorylase family protein
MTYAAECAIVVAVGLSNHQTQLAYSRSRAMLPALGKPLAARALDRLYSAGIRRYIIVLGEDEGGVAAYLNDHHLLPEASVEIVVQTNADSMNQVLHDISARCKPPFLATSYNSFAHPHFGERLLKLGAAFGDALVVGGADAPLTRSDHGYVGQANADKLLDISPRQTSTDQPDGILLTDMALCGSAFVDFVSQSAPRRSLMELFQDYVAAKKLAYVVRAGWVLQVFTDKDLHALNTHLLEEEEDVSILSEIPANVQIIPPVRIDPQVSVGPEACIGPYVYLESGSNIGHHAVLSHALVLQRATVPPHAVISDAIISSRARIDI